jgi:hypothetical protein
MFQAQKLKMPPHCTIAVTGWSITDNEHQKHYWLQANREILSVSRQYTLPLLRMTTLSKNVLLCLFDGIVEAIDLHLKPETLHFGVDASSENNSFLKKLRNADGRESGVSIPVPQNSTTDRVIQIAKMVRDIKEKLQEQDPPWKYCTSAEFALAMIEGVERVRFTR